MAHERAVFKAAAVVSETKRVLKNLDAFGLAELRALQKLFFHFFFFQFMKFVKKLRDGEYTIENNQACLSFIFTVFRLFIADLSVKSERKRKKFTCHLIYFFLIFQHLKFQTKSGNF